MKRVIELIRVSTTEQSTDRHAALPAQRATNAQTAIRFGLTIEIVDVSGANVRNSPQMQDLLLAIQSPDIHGIVAREFSRLMRMDSWDDFAILQRLHDTQTLLYLPEGPSDMGSAQGRLLSAIKATFAGEERNEFKRRSFGAKEERRKQGGSPQSFITIPFGVAYNKASGYTYTHPDSDKVKLAFQAVLGEKSATCA